MGRIFYEFYWLLKESIGSIPGRVIACVFLVALCFIPLFTDQAYILRIFILACIFAIFAASWDFLSGYTGLLNFGHAAFFGISAYVCGILSSRFGLAPWLTIPIGSFIAMLMGLLVGAPALRLRGIYLALVTLAFPTILAGFVFAFPNFSGGELGIFGIAPLASSRVMEYYIILAIMILSLLIMWKLTDVKSKIVRTGVIFRAISQDEITARACGIFTTNYKFLAFGVSGFFAGIAGGLYAHFIKVVGPSTLELLFSFQAILWTIFGGFGTIYGAVVGVFLLFPLTEFLTLSEVGTEIRFILLAVILILTLLFMPEGLATWVLDRIEKECPRCKITNAATRKVCRACGAPLHLVEQKGG
jgi:branched-chain amino acid transport system permease protein